MDPSKWNGTGDAEMKRELFYSTYPLPGFMVLLVLFLVPVCMTLGQAFVVDGGFSFSLIASTFTDPYYLRIMAFTLIQALCSTLASLLIGLPGAYLMTTYRFPGKRLLKTLYAIPFVLPSILVVLGFVIFYGNSGFLNKALMAVFGLNEPPLRILYSFTAVLLAHAFYNFPVVVSIVGDYWQRLDSSCESAASTLGSKRAKVFKTITLPRLAPSILSAASLVFLFCFTSFAIILVLGGGPALTTTEVEIYRLARISMDTGRACALSLFSMLVAIVAMFVYSAAQRRQNHGEALGNQNAKLERKPRGFGQHLGIIIYLVFSLLFILCPILSIVARSLLGNATRSGGLTFSLAAYERLFAAGSSNLKAVAASVAIALASSLLATAAALRICTSIARSNKAGVATDVAVMLPMVTSSVIVGLSYFIVSKYMKFMPPFVLVVLAHCVITMPFVVRTILPVYRKIPENLVNASYTLGFGARQTFRKVIRPILMPAMLTGMVFSFAMSMGELNATLLLGTTSMQTIPIQIYRLISSYNYQGACALGCILILVCFVVFFISETLKRRSYV